MDPISQFYRIQSCPISVHPLHPFWKEKKAIWQGRFGKIHPFQLIESFVCNSHSFSLFAQTAVFTSLVTWMTVELFALLTLYNRLLVDSILQGASLLVLGILLQR